MTPCRFTRLLPPTLVVLVLAGTASPSLADFYRYRDSRGVVHMTNRLESVPAKYRATMKVTREDAPPPPPQAAAPQEEAAPRSAPAPAEAVPAAPEGRFAQLSARWPWFKPLVVLGVLFGALLLVIKLTSYLSSPQLTRVVYVAFFLGVFCFAYVSYARHLAAGFSSVKEKVLAMFVKANRREGAQPPGGQ